MGKNAGVLPGDVVGCIAGESGLPREVVGAIHLLPTVTLVQVASEHVDEIMNAIDGVKLRNRKLGVSIGTPPAPQPNSKPGRGRDYPPRDGGRPERSERPPGKFAKKRERF
jgi:ATP-dependent RNA helicase DeaD